MVDAHKGSKTHNETGGIDRHTKQVAKTYDTFKRHSFFWELFRSVDKFSSTEVLFTREDLVHDVLKNANEGRHSEKDALSTQIAVKVYCLRDTAACAPTRPARALKCWAFQFQLTGLGDRSTM